MNVNAENAEKCSTPDLDSSMTACVFVNLVVQENTARFRSLKRVGAKNGKNKVGEMRGMQWSRHNK